LRRLHRLHSDLPRRAFQTQRARRRFTFQQKPVLFFGEFIADAAQALGFISISERRKMLSTRVNKTTSQHQAAQQKERQTYQRAGFTLARDECVSLS